MIQAKFYKSQELLTGFTFSGHSGYAESGEDIVCAAVSSAVQLTVNMLDEFDCDPNVSAEENVVDCRITASHLTADAILTVFRKHLESILEEFPKTIKITISEV